MYKNETYKRNSSANVNFGDITLLKQLYQADNIKLLEVFSRQVGIVFGRVEPANPEFPQSHCLERFLKFIHIPPTGLGKKELWSNVKGSLVLLSNPMKYRDTILLMHTFISSRANLSAGTETGGGFRQQLKQLID